MRTLRLARIAAEAEALRLRKQAQRMIVRLVMGIIALGFAGAALACFHMFIWFAFRRWAGWTTPWSAMALVGFDVVLALVFGLMTLVSRPGRVELEALQVRRRALENATTSVALSSILVPAVRTAINLLRRPR